MMAMSNNKGSRFAVLETEEPEGMADEHRLAGVIRRNNDIEQREEGRRLFGKSPAPSTRFKHS